MRPYSAWLDINNEYVEAYSVSNERALFTLARRRCSYCARGNRQSMDRTSTDLLLDEGAQPQSDESAFDLAQYTLQQVRRDAEFVLSRGRAGSRPSILVRAPLADQPSPATLRKMQHEYALRSELDPAHVVRPLALVLPERRPMLILQDPGGTPLDLL